MHAAAQSTAYPNVVIPGRGRGWDCEVQVGGFWEKGGRINGFGGKVSSSCGQVAPWHSLVPVEVVHLCRIVAPHIAARAHGA